MANPSGRPVHKCTREDTSQHILTGSLPAFCQARMSKEDLAPFGGVVLAFMFVCAIIGGAAFFVVGGSSVQVHLKHYGVTYHGCASTHY